MLLRKPADYSEHVIGTDDLAARVLKGPGVQANPLNLLDRRYER